MSGQVYKTIEIVGSSATTLEDAVQVAVKKASATVHNLRWFEVTQIRGGFVDEKLSEWQVIVKVAFELD
jgi:dodecin